MAEIVYLLCALTSAFCAVLLVRSHRRQRTRLLMWSSLCFIGLALTNVLLVLDLVIVPDHDLSMARTGVSLVAMVLLLIGLLGEAS